MSRRYKGGVISATAPTTSTSVATGVWTLPQQMQAIVGSGWPFQPAPPGSDSYTTAGTFTWVAPAGVTSVSVVAVGGGGHSAVRFGCACCGFHGGPGGGGGALAYANTISVTPGSGYTVVVGAGGQTNSASGGNSYFNTTCTVRANGGTGGSGTSTGGAGGTVGAGTGGPGGAGGDTQGFNGCATGQGGGGAGGYGAGGGGTPLGAGSQSYGATGGANGAGGGGSSGGWSSGRSGGGGGGVGLLGQGSSGAALACGGVGGIGGNAGSGGTNGQAGSASNVQASSGGAYGGGGGSTANNRTDNVGAGGAVRIVWPGTTRTFPSTCVGAP